MIIKGTVLWFYNVGPRNRLQLRNTVNFGQFFISLNPVAATGNFFGVKDRSNRDVIVTGWPFRPIRIAVKSTVVAKVIEKNLKHLK